MCEECNIKKGNGLILLTWNDKNCVPGNEVWIKNHKKFEFKGIIEKVDVNPYTERIEVFVANKRGSCYKRNKNLYIGIGNLVNSV